METTATTHRKIFSNAADARSGFAVEDVLSVAIRKTESDSSPHKAMIQAVVYEQKGLVRPDQKFPEDNVQVHVWNKLIEIDQKLNFLLEKLIIKSDDDPDAQPCPVWMSETGIRLMTPLDLSPGDAVELRLLVPVQPRAWVVLYGIVSEIEIGDSSNRSVTIAFSDMDDDIRQMIRYYLLNRQREMIRRLKKMGE